MKFEWISTKLRAITFLTLSDSFWSLTSELTCCAVRVMHVLINRYAMNCFSRILWISSRNSALIIVINTLVNKKTFLLGLLYEQILHLCWILSMCSRANDVSYYYYSCSIVRCCSFIISVNIYVSDCFLSVKVLLFDFIQLQGEIGFILSKLNVFSELCNGDCA